MSNAGLLSELELVLVFESPGLFSPFVSCCVEPDVKASWVVPWPPAQAAVGGGAARARGGGLHVKLRGGFRTESFLSFSINGFPTTTSADTGDSVTMSMSTVRGGIPMRVDLTPTLYAARSARTRPAGVAMDRELSAGSVCDLSPKTAAVCWPKRDCEKDSSKTAVTLSHSPISERMHMACVRVGGRRRRRRRVKGVAAGMVAIS